ncbi:MAG: flagellar hook-basal body complex protein [Lachnospiraceae bacterium]|nr:flagellar hook-basal body complex protein [Lachnospiraceae bacterium]
MMRSMYSGVAGLKTHQTRMDVIGNNIANVNTVGFKGSSVNFADTFYQTVSSATGSNAELGTAGTNAKQIGLGSTVASITTNITEQGGTQSTNRSLDIAINGESFLIVRSGTDTLFTKSGALNIDEVGNLYCTTNGATVQGWLADDKGEIIKDTVKDLSIMSGSNLYYEPEATQAITLGGNIDPNDTKLNPTYGAGGAPISGGQVMTFSFYDNIGEQYSVKLYVSKAQTQTAGTVKYDVRVGDVYNASGESIFVLKTVDAATGAITYSASDAKVQFAGGEVSAANVDAQTGELTLEATQLGSLIFSSSTGDYVNTQNGTTDRPNAVYQGKALNFSVIGPVPIHQGENIVNGTNAGGDSTFLQHDDTNDTGGVNIYFDDLTQYSQGGTSKLSSNKGDPDGYYAGNKAGNMKGISISSDGKVYGNYDNGMKKCLAQIAVATFSNPSGLEAMGDSLFAASLNSGPFDGIGEEVSLSGSFTVGALEMSNVDLSTEFTNMITTQRGFQANSRIITTSDTMLEELVNLKR